MCIPSEDIPDSNVHFRRGTCPFPVRMYIPGEDELQWNEHPHREGGCASRGMGMCLNGNAHPHQECISSPGMHIVYIQGEFMILNLSG